MTHRTLDCWSALSMVGLLGLVACDGGGTGGPRITAPDAATHSARYFPVLPGETHALATLTALAASGPSSVTGVRTCDGCHADRSDPSVWPPPPSTSFKTYTCTGCHVLVRPGIYHDDVAGLASIALHGGMSAFDPAQPVTEYDHACHACHPQGVGVDHAPIFPLPHQNAAATIVAGCSDCHVNPVDRKQLGCAACHPHSDAATATGHAKVPDFSASDSGLCARCHGDDTIPVTVATHTAFSIEAGSSHTGLAGGACLGCHPQNRTARKAFAADFTQFTCTSCHVALAAANAAFHDDGTALATYHASKNVSGFAFTDAACLSCHVNGGAGAPANHPALFPIGAGTKHVTVGCSQCHGANRSDVTQLACAACHNGIAGFSTKHNAIGGVSIMLTTLTSCATAPVDATSANCVKCHSNSQVDRVSAHPTDGSSFGRGGHQRGGCLTCHVVQLSTKPYPAIDFTQPASARTSTAGCATCHNNGCGGN